MKNIKESYGLFYLKTGGGHLAGARAVQSGMAELFDDVECHLYDGFENVFPLVKWGFEGGYHWSSNYFEQGFVTFYQFTQMKLFLNYFHATMGPLMRPHLRKFILEKKLTKIISFHHVLTPLLVDSVNQLGLDIPVFCVVMDPFTVHNVWFYDKRARYIVLSNTAKQRAITEFGISENSIVKFDCMISNKFNTRYSEAEIKDFRKKLNIPDGKKVCLLAGGGEGLRNGLDIVKEFIKNNFSHYLIIVCGKNKILQQRIQQFVNKMAVDNVLVFGFVDFMYELMNIADCVVCKGGPATVFETLLLEKPLIICDFIRGQEYGNVFYVEENGLGYHESNPKRIFNCVEKIFSDEKQYSLMKQNIQNLQITNGLNGICSYIYTD